MGMACCSAGAQSQEYRGRSKALRIIPIEGWRPCRGSQRALRTLKQSIASALSKTSSRSLNALYLALLRVSA